MDRVSTAAVSHGGERQGGRERHDRIFVTFDLIDCKTHNWRLGVIERGEKKVCLLLEKPLFFQLAFTQTSCSFLRLALSCS